jgi:hypothetical protein
MLTTLFGVVASRATLLSLAHSLFIGSPDLSAEESQHNSLYEQEEIAARRSWNKRESGTVAGSQRLRILARTLGNRLSRSSRREKPAPDFILTAGGSL